ncbi:MAG: PAS domain S-box protein [Spirochaetia bacterium]|nr:PAS domain S-box protein [Spirochaetia bacterium]
MDKVKKITRYGYVLKNSGEFVLIETINMAFDLFEAHQNVKEREKRYKSVFHNSHSPMMLIEPETGNIIDVNRAALEFYRWPPEVLTSMKIQEINQLSEKEVLQEMKRAREEERNVFYFKHKIADGSIRDVEVRSSPILIQNRQLLFSIINDVTEKNLAEENLRKSEEQFRAIVEENPEPLFIQTESRFAYLNPAAAKLFGATSASDVIGTLVVDRLHPAFRSIALERIRKLNVERRTVSDKTDLKFLRMDGTSVWVETIGIPIEFKGKQGAIVSVRDVTDRKQREKRLQESEENLCTTLNSIGDAVISTDTDGKIVHMNPVAEMLTGWSVQEAKGENLGVAFHIINADTRELVNNPVEKVLENGEIVGLANHTMLISKQGDEYQIADSAAPIKDDEGNITGVVLVFRDVTEQYEKDRQIAENERKYRGLFNSIRDAILVADTDRNIIDCNPAFTDLFGYSLEDLQGKKTVTIYKNEEEYNQMGMAIKEHKGDLKDFLFPVHYRKKDETIFLGETNVFFLKDVENRITGFIGLIRDITDKKRSEDNVKKINRRLETLMGNLPGIAYISKNDWNWTMEFVSEGAFALTEYLPEELKENQVISYGELIIPEDKEHVWEAVQTALTQMRHFQLQYQITTKTGKLKWVWEQGIGIYTSENKLHHIEGFITDITSHKKTEEKLVNTIAQKDYYMKELNHRTKNNLNMISSLISLKESEIENDLSDLRQRMEIIKLVHEKLHQQDDIGQIEVKEYFQDILESIFYSTSSRTVQIINKVEDVYIPTKTAISLGLVINEIATNAIKHGFSEREEAVFTIEMKKDTQNTQYELTLSNTGNPFPEDIEIESTDTLGLQLINSLVAQLDGTIDLQKKPNPVFTIRFPIEEE